MTKTVACWAGRTYTFDPKATAFVAIDMQRDFLAPDGPVGAEGSAGLRQAMPGVTRATAAARKAGLHVVHTREGYLPDGSDMHAMKKARGFSGKPGPYGPVLIRGNRGQDFYDGFEPKPGEAVFDKPGFSAFHGTALLEHLRGRGITHLILTGITTQCCVHSTVRAAVDHGFYCLTVEDACAAIERPWHDAAIALIASENHLFGWVCGVKDLEAALA
jgi:nicotinamidase-related amidase